MLLRLMPSSTFQLHEHGQSVRIEELRACIAGQLLPS